MWILESACNRLYRDSRFNYVSKPRIKAIYTKTEIKFGFKKERENERQRALANCPAINAPKAHDVESPSEACLPPVHITSFVKNPPVPALLIMPVTSYHTPRLY